MTHVTTRTISWDSNAASSACRMSASRRSSMRSRRPRRRRRPIIRSAPSSRMSARSRCRIRASTSSRCWASRNRSFRPASPSSISPAWCAAPRKARGSATSFSPPSARSTPSCMWCAASRTRDVTHVEGKIDPIADIDTIETELMLADLESPGKARRRAGEKGQGHRRGRQARQGNARSDQPLARAAARGQAGAPGRAQARGGKAVPLARPAHLGAGALCLQRRGSLRRDRQRLLPQGRAARQGRGRGRGGDLGQDRIRDRDAAAGRTRGISRSGRPARRPGSTGWSAPATRCCIW